MTTTMDNVPALLRELGNAQEQAAIDLRALADVLKQASSSLLGCAAAYETASVRHVYPHMCRDGHPEIGHSTDEEMCPVCVVMGKRDDHPEGRDLRETGPL